jgi:hypothetical protein
LNLIRVMPAKGQDKFVGTSIFLAKLIGPIALVAAIGLLFNAGGYRAMAREFLRSLPLIYLSGILAMTAGVAVVLYHNVWVADWRVIVTLFGWAGAIGGAARMLMPDKVRSVGEAMLGRPLVSQIGGACWVLFGAVLCFYGYFR